VLLNGPAARLANTGDKVIVITYCQLPEDKARTIKAEIVLVDDKNKVKETTD